MDRLTAPFGVIFSTMSEGVILLDAEGRIQASNGSAQGILGLTSDELRGLSLFDPRLGTVGEDQSPLPTDSHPAFITLRTGKPQSGVILGIRKHDGRLTWVSANTQRMADGESGAQIVVTLTDVTSRVESERARQAGEERWKLVIESSRDGIWDWNIRSGEIYFSRRWKEILGFDEDEIGNARWEWEGRLHPEDRQATLDAVARHLRGESPSYRAEYRLQCKDGSWKWILARGHVVGRDGDGRPLRFLGTHTDVTERRDAEEKLRSSEQRFATLFLCNPAAAVISDYDDGGRITDANDAFERITGYQRSEVIGRLEGEFWVDQQEYARAGREFRATGRLSDFEFRFRRKDGEIRIGVLSAAWIELNGKMCVAAAAVDITDRRLAEDALREREAKFRAVIENSHDGILFVDATGSILYQSLSYTAITGYLPHERIGRDGFELVHPDDLATVRRGFLELVVEPARPRQMQYRLRHKDGGWRWVEASAQNLLDNPNAKAVIVTAKDITERKRSEEELRSSRQWLDLFVQQTPLAVIEFDILGRIRAWNPAAVHVFGYTPEEAIGQHWTLIVPEMIADAVKGVWDAVASHRGGERSVNENRTKDGRLIICHWFNTTLLDESGTPVGVASLVLDVTESRRAEQEAERLQRELAQVQKMESIGRLAGGVAHDFNNILTVINGYSVLAMAGLKPGDPLRTQLEEIHKAGERAAALTRQLLAFSRKQLLQPRVLDLNGVVRNMESMLQRLMGEDVAVEFALAAETLAVLADPHQLEQVIMNLAVNSRDAMPRGGRLQIESALVDRDEMYARTHAEARPGRFALLTVRDNGHGMDEATRQRIFEPFFTTKGAGQGTGLGLSMVHGIVAQSGGFIEVASEVGGGTALKIYLPAAEGALMEPDEAETRTPAAGRETILVVEDQPEVRHLVSSVLKARGYCVIEAANAGEAIMICEQDQAPIQLVLTDVVMPHTSGRELAARLSQLRPRLKVLFMSGYSDHVVAGPVHGDFAHFVQKPFTPEELANKVRDALGSVAATDLR